jgi:hypothetical protein
LAQCVTVSQIQVYLTELYTDDSEKSSISARTSPPPPPSLAFAYDKGGGISSRESLVPAGRGFTKEAFPFLPWKVDGGENLE